MGWFVENISPLYRKGVWGIGNILGLLYLTKVPLTGGGFRGWVTHGLSPLQKNRSDKNHS